MPILSNFCLKITNRLSHKCSPEADVEIAFIQTEAQIQVKTGRKWLFLLQDLIISVNQWLHLDKIVNDYPRFLSAVKIHSSMEE